jgi:hypothetical protein
MKSFILRTSKFAPIVFVALVFSACYDHKGKDKDEQSPFVERWMTYSAAMRENESWADERMEASNDSTPRITGDFDGDAKTEDAYLYRMNYGQDSIDTGVRCGCWVEVRGAKFSKLKVPACGQNHIENEGDLTQDGTDEIGVSVQEGPDDWRTYYVFTYQSGAWKAVLAPIKVNTRVWDTVDDLIKTIPSKPGWLEVASQVHDDEGYGMSAHYETIRMLK